MPEVVTDIVIEASAERVWRTLTDLPAYPGWNPVLRRVTGDLAVGQTLGVVRIKPDGGETTEHPSITHYRPDREIRWRTRVGLPWLLDTERSLKIERLGPERVRFVHWLNRTGLLAYLVPGGSESSAREQLDVMNLALAVSHRCCGSRRSADHDDLVVQDGRHLEACPAIGGRRLSRAVRDEQAGGAAADALG